jgi:putative ABC transport system permease protein
MLKNYLKVAMRNLIRNKTYSFTNITGLAIGLVCSIFIMLWVRYELSYDRHHEKVDQITLAYLKGTQEDQTSYQSTTSPIIANILQRDFPEIINTARAGFLGEVVLKTGDKKITESRGIGADPEFLNIFTFHFLKGNAVNALAGLHSVILSESMANKYFGQEDPIGKILVINNQFDFFVTAVIQDIPANSHLLYDFIVPFEFLKDLGFQITGREFFPCNYFTYALLQNNISLKSLNEKVSQHIISKGEVITFQITLIPLTEVYLQDNGGKQKIYIFSLIAMIIIVIACINFMNLTIAQASKRAKEVGIRKVIGATRIQIAEQILGESLIMVLVAILLALIGIELFLPYFNNIINKEISLSYLDREWLLFLIGLVLFSGFLAGSYPAFFLSSFRPAKVLKTGSTNWSNRPVLRRALLILQFSVSILFIIITLVMSRQMQYIRSLDLGLNEENILYVQLDGDIKGRIPELKNELRQNANIQLVSSSSRIPTVITWGNYRKWGRPEEPSRRICEVIVDEDYFETFGLQMIDGRFFSKSFLSDANESVIVNEAAIKLLGQGNYVNNPFYYDDRNYTLIGVIKDFQHISPIYSAPQPLIFRLNPNENKFLFVKIHPSVKDIHAVTETVNYIKSVCNSFSPDFPLSYSFLNEFTYERERDMASRQKIIFYATLFAIIISCLGLFSLSAFLNEQRTKEIGIRKAIGATVTNVLVLLTKDYAKWILLANLIAWPIAWYSMNKWLEDFAFKIPIPWDLFLAAGALALLVSLITVSFQAFRAANANPVKSLLYE